MVEVFAVLVLVRDGLVLVHVGVRAGGHGIVRVRVVAVVVRVKVLVARRLVVVAVALRP